MFDDRFRRASNASEWTPGIAALAILSADGARLLSATYLGGNGDEMFRSITFGADGSVYLVGSTSSADFPVTANAVQAKFGGGTADAFVARLLPE